MPREVTPAACGAFDFFKGSNEVTYLHNISSIFWINLSHKFDNSKCPWVAMEMLINTPYICVALLSL